MTPPFPACLFMTVKPASIPLPLRQLVRDMRHMSAVVRSARVNIGLGLSGPEA